ncbi:MAG: hypothetical protein AAF125_09355 [Chloroflexota bacterium]
MKFYLPLLFLLLFASGCTYEDRVVIDTATISASAPYTVTVTGITDGCIAPIQTRTAQSGSQIDITVYRMLERGEPCPEIAMFVEQVIPLPAGFDPSTDGVSVNGVVATQNSAP